MLFQKRPVRAAVAVAAAVVLTGCTAFGDATPSATPTSTATITIGIVTSETGDLAADGQQYLEGLKAGFADATNGTGVVDGFTLDVEYRDDAGSPPQALAAVADLTNAGATIIAGSAASDVALSIADEAQAQEFLFISGSATADAITGRNDHTFRSGRQQYQDIATAAEFLDDLTDARITVFAQDSPSGRDVAAAFAAQLGSGSAEVDSLLVPQDVTDFTAFAQQLRADAPDLVYVDWVGATAPAMWDALKAAGVLDAAPVVTSLGPVATFGSYGTATGDIDFAAHWFPGATDSSVADAMVDAIRTAGGTPDLLSADGYTAALMIVHAIESGHGDVDAMIAALEGWTFDSPKGSVTVRASDHALVQDMFQAQLTVVDGAYSPSRTARVRAAEVAPPEPR